MKLRIQCFGILTDDFSSFVAAERLCSGSLDILRHPLRLAGLISFEEFRQTWKLLSSHLKMEISDKAVTDLAQSIDFNKDGSIDINEFMEAFRLVHLSTNLQEPRL